MRGDLLSGVRNGDRVTLTWGGDLQLAGLMSQVLLGFEAEVAYPGVDDDVEDPVTRLEEEMLGEKIAASATKIAQSDQVVGAAVLRALMVSGTATVTSEQLWALVGAANGAYVRFRNADLDACGEETEIGAPGELDLDGTLAQLLGEEVRSAGGMDNWSMESALFGALADYAMDIAQS